MRQKLLCALTTSMFALSPIAAAEVQFNGFASIVSGIDLEDDGNPVAGYNNDTANNLQSSKVALQWAADLDKGMRFVGQAMARGDSDDGYVLKYDWAYFDFNIGDSGKLKVGKIRTPLYKYSDYLDVGYAYHWIAPPQIMYSGTFNNVDGIGYQLNFETGALEQSINVVFGRFQSNDIERATPFDLRNFITLNWSATMGDHEFNAVYAQADVYFDSTGVTAAAAGAGLAGIPSADVIVSGDLGQFYGVGYKGTFGDISVLTEYKIVTVQDSILSDEDSGGYVGATYNMDDYTYHLTYEFGETKAQTYSQAGGAFQPTADGVVGDGDASSITIGVRKDIGISSALKMDLTSHTQDKDGLAPVTSAPTGKVEKTALVLKIALETMF
jgi:hypothetical protein